MPSSTDASEVELKLVVAPDDLPWLEAHPLLRGAGRPRRLVSTYFDTPDQRLREAGFTLRIRKDGRRRVLTVKQSSAPSAGLFARGEWESEVAADHPDEAALQDTPVAALLGADGGIATLRPLFTIRTDRTARLVEYGDDAEIELVLDRGIVKAGGRSAPLIEVELELKRGRPADLFALAAMLFEAPPLRISSVAKSDAGYALLQPRRDAVKARDVRLVAGTSTAEAFQVIGQACLSHFVSNEPLLRLGRAPAALHQARIALRRFRAAMSLFAPLLADAQSQRLKAEMRRVAGALGEGRDLDVLAARLKASGATAAVRAQVEDERLAAYDRLIAVLETPSAARLAFDLAAWLQGGDWLSSDAHGLARLRRRPVEDFAAEVLDKRRRRVKKRAPHLQELDPEARHELRIEVKKLRYAAEFFQSLAQGGKGRKRAKGFLAALRPLQESLGELNDIAAQGAMAHRFGPELAAALEAGAADEAAHLAAAEESARRFVEMKPFLEP